MNDFHHPATSFSAVQYEIIIDNRGDHAHATGVVSKEIFSLHDFLIDRLGTSCISLH
jgi:hypothetical protein